MKSTGAGPSLAVVLAVPLLIACPGDQEPYAVDLLPGLIGHPLPGDRLLDVDLNGGPSERWVLEQALVIGSPATEGSEGGGDDFFQVITDVQLLSDGRIAVLDPGASSVALYDEDGVLDAVLGGEGDGPGEFRYPEGVRECGQDGIHVVDGATMRMKVFDTDASFRHEYRLFGYNPNQPFWSWDCADGRVLTMQWGDGDPRIGEVGRFRKRVPLALSGPDGRVTNALGSILGPERYRFENRGTGPAPVGAVTGLAIHDGIVYVAEGPEIRVDAFSVDGDHLWTVRAAAGRRPVDRGAFVESQRPDQMTDAERRAFNARWRDWDFPDLLPAFRGFLVDDEGLMWIERYPSPGDRTTTWWVIDAEGTWRATAEVPGHVELMDVEGGRVAGVMRGDLDVERAVVFDVRVAGGTQG